MRAAINEKFGGAEVLVVREIAEPHARSGQLRVRVSAAGLNPMDWMFIADDDLGRRLRDARSHGSPGLALLRQTRRSAAVPTRARDLREAVDAVDLRVEEAALRARIEERAKDV
ncbi:MAG TPA: hypothetical protein VGL81_16485, partial [Polyangiaceae bacterium]